MQQQPPPEREKILRWVKASERLPKNGDWNARYSFNRCVLDIRKGEIYEIRGLTHLLSYKEIESNYLEWLEEIEAPAASPVMRLDIGAFSKLSAQRAETGFKTYKNVPITYWTTALAGEVGELCNMIKKMERVANGGIDGGSSYTAASLSKTDLAEEIGGIFIYLNLLAGLLDIDMEESIIETFNSKSKKYGFPELYPSPAPVIEPGEQKMETIIEEAQAKCPSGIEDEYGAVLWKQGYCARAKEEYISKKFLDDGKEKNRAS